MTAVRRLLVTALFSSLVLPLAPLASQTSEDDPCVCPLPRASRGGGLGGLFGLAALGLARVGSGVRSVLAEAVQEPVVVAAEDSILPPGVAGLPLAADTTRDTTEVALTVAPTAAPTLAMAAPRDAAPVGLVAPRTATRLPLLALLGLSAVLAGVALRVRTRSLATHGMSAGDRRRLGSARTVLFVPRRTHRSRFRLR